MQSRAIDHRRAAAERNVQAILDSAEQLLERRQPVSIAAVAAYAGVSRVTVYAHFPTREALLEAVVERAAGRSAAALDAAQPGTSPPLEALERLLTAGWRELARTDVPPGWLTVSFFALIHTCAREVHAGRISDATAPHILKATIRDIFTGPGQG